MKKIFTLLILFTLVYSASASKTYNGYVLLNDNSKIEGTIQMLSPTLNEVKVKFTSKEGKKQTYKAKEVKEYAFKVEKWNNKTRKHDSIIIIYSRQKVERSPVPFGPTEVLVEREITGHINFYNHYVESNTNPDSPVGHITYAQKGTDDLINITKDNYKDVIKEMTAEYPELSARVGNKGYTFRNLAKTISSYNEWMLDNGEEMVLDM